MDGTNGVDPYLAFDHERYQEIVRNRIVREAKVFGYEFIDSNFDEVKLSNDIQAFLKAYPDPKSRNKKLDQLECDEKAASEQLKKSSKVMRKAIPVFKKLLSEKDSCDTGESFKTPRHPR